MGTCEEFLKHHGIKGQEWGVKNGPPYPLDREKHNEVVSGDNNGKHGDAALAAIAAYYTVAMAVTAAPVIIDAVKVNKLDPMYKRGYSKPKSKDDITTLPEPEPLDQNDPKAINELGLNRDSNCYSCSTAWLMRKLGYDVVSEATANPEAFSKYGDTFGIVKDITGKEQQLTIGSKDWYDFYDGFIKKYSIDAGLTNFGFNNSPDTRINRPNLFENLSKQMLSKYKNGTMGYFEVDWACGGGHSVVFYIKDGKFVVYDPQNGKYYDESSSKFWNNIGYNPIAIPITANNLNLDKAVDYIWVNQNDDDKNAYKKKNVITLVRHNSFDESDFLAHHGIKGQEWGVRNGPPYPLARGKLSAEEKAAKKIKFKHNPVASRKYDVTKKLPKEDLLKSKDAMRLWLQRDDLTTSEIKERLDRLDTEKKLQTLMMNQNEKAKFIKHFEDLINNTKDDFKNAKYNKLLEMAWNTIIPILNKEDFDTDNYPTPVKELLEWFFGQWQKTATPPKSK